MCFCWFSGDVVVSKMPALHPGDARKFTAVNRPDVHEALKHLVDCIVFPQKVGKVIRQQSKCLVVEVRQH